MIFNKNINFSIFFVLSIASLVFAKCSITNSTYLSPLGEIKSPPDNLLDTAKIALGKAFFFDKRLSLDESISCAVCHKPGLAFTDGLQFSEGILGRKSARNSPTLLNVAFAPKLMFDGEIPTLEMQSIVPIQDHNEMGMEMKALIVRLKAVPAYKEAAKRIFNRDMDVWVLTRSLSAYQRSLISDNAPFDKFYYEKKNTAMSASAKRGWTIFSEKLYCTKCHPAPYFTNFKVENNGLYDTYPDNGRFRINNDSTEMGKFKVPTLRNIQITDPYMHDGTYESLSKVIDHYASGGKNHKNKSAIIKPFTLTKKEKNDLIEFLYSLTDMSFMERL